MDVINPFGFLRGNVVVHGVNSPQTTANVDSVAASGTRYTVSGPFHMELNGEILTFVTGNTYVLPASVYSAVHTAATAAGVTLTSV